jgi:heme/copper-type cytochrome/quinol oxidase subunit 3
VLVATFFVIAAGTVFVGGLLAGYFEARAAVLHAGQQWGPKSPGDLPNVALAVTYFALLLSAGTMQWAYSSIKADERRHAAVAVGTTLLLGAAFVNGLSFCYTQLGLKAGDDGFANQIYAVSGGHLVLVLVAMGFLAVMGFRVLGGQFGPRNAEFVASAAAFWHFVVISGMVVWWSLWFLLGGPN